jgi:hypothetical protein
MGREACKCFYLGDLCRVRAEFDCVAGCFCCGRGDFCGVRAGFSGAWGRSAGGTWCFCRVRGDFRGVAGRFWCAQRDFACVSIHYPMEILDFECVRPRFCGARGELFCVFSGSSGGKSWREPAGEGELSGIRRGVPPLQGFAVFPLGIPGLRSCVAGPGLRCLAPMGPSDAWLGPSEAGLARSAQTSGARPVPILKSRVRQLGTGPGRAFATASRVSPGSPA